jgi:hypothetical protein
MTVSGRRLPFLSSHADWQLRVQTRLFRDPPQNVWSQVNSGRYQVKIGH